MKNRAKVTWNSWRATTVVDGFTLGVERQANGSYRWRVWRTAADLATKTGESNGERQAKAAALQAVRRIQKALAVKP
jgi:uncharacterized protein YciW